MLCAYCGVKIPDRRVRHNATFCSKDCLNKRDREAYRTQNPRLGASRKGSTGAASELAVCVDLLRRGYHVFRSVAPDGVCDLLILKDREALRIEVKTSCKNRDGSIHWPKVTKQIGKHDVLAIVVAGQVYYQPETF